MEEDEAGDGGFPLIVDNEDDEHLLTKEERFYSSVEVTGIMKQQAGAEIVNVPVARRTLGSEGMVQFEIDTSAAELRNVTSFCFRHTETGASYIVFLGELLRQTMNKRTLESISVLPMGYQDPLSKNRPRHRKIRTG
jgi:GTPase